MKVLFLSFTISIGFLAPANAQCRLMPSAGKCIDVPVSDFAPLEAGTPIPEDARMVMNPVYYGLPRVDGSYRYYVIERQVYRVDNRKLEVIDHVGLADRRLW